MTVDSPRRGASNVINREERLRRRRQTQEQEEREALLESMAHTRGLIAQAYSGFNMSSDPDLIESYVFEINALQARYSYLLRRVKALDGAPAPLAIPSTVR